MTRLFANANYDFIGVRRYAYGVTAAVLLPGLLFLMLAGLNYSIEFTGGTLVQIRSQKTVDVAQLRSGLDQQGIHGAEIQGFGAPNEYVIRARVAKPGTDANDTQATAAAVSHALDAVLGEEHDADGWRLRVDLPVADAARLASQADGAPLRPLLPLREPESVES